MQYLLIALKAVLPLLLILLLGYGLKKAGAIRETTSEDLNKLLFKIFLPLLVFKNVYTSDLEELFSHPTLLYIIIFTIIVFIVFYFIIKLVEKDNKSRGVMLQGIVRVSALLFGLPLTASILAPEKMGIVALATTLTVFFNAILPATAFALYSSSSKQKFSFKELLKQLFTNPILLAALLALALRAVNLNIPEVLTSTINKLSAVAIPLAFILIGAGFKFTKLEKLDSSLVFTVLSRTIIVPALALLGAILLGLRNENLLAVLAVFAGPTSVSSYPEAVAHDADTKLANDIVVYTMLVDVFTIIIFITILASLGYISA